METTRERLGVSRPQMRQLTRSYSGFALENRLRKLLRLKVRFIEEIRARLDREARDPAAFHDHDGTVYITTSQASRALGMNAFKLTTLRQRNQIPEYRFPAFRFPFFKIDDLEELAAMELTPGRHHAPMAPEFVAFVTLRDEYTAEKPVAARNP